MFISYFEINTTMRLYEVTSGFTPDKFTPGEVRSTGDAGFGLGDEQEELGRGIFGKAFSTPQEPGTVRKVVGPISEHEFGRDAYFKYLKLLVKNDRFANNPYFPKIFDLQVKKFPLPNLDPENQPTPYRYAYAVDIERLHNYDDLSNREALAIGKRMFYDFERLVKKDVKGIAKWGEDYKEGKPYKREYRMALISLIESVVDYPKMFRAETIFKDPDFKKAAMLLRNLRSKTQKAGITMFFDLHSGNIMVRRGPAGPHLVFSDPVAH